MKTTRCFLFLILIIVVIASCRKKKPSCSDGLLNQNEIQTDCGGPCKPCTSCFDGIVNQDEQGIDCGGICIPCGTCSDGIKNNSETSVDCGGPCTCGIVYPVFGLFGHNVLRDDTITLKSLNSLGIYSKYSLAANVSKGASLRVVFTSLQPDGQWLYYSATEQGWSISPVAPVQQFTCNFPVNCDVHMFFSGTGSALIEMYENGATSPSRTKTITWKP